MCVCVCVCVCVFVAQSGPGKQLPTWGSEVELIDPSLAYFHLLTPFSLHA